MRQDIHNQIAVNLLILNGAMLSPLKFFSRLFIFLHLPATAYCFTVSGRVTDTIQNPLAFATVYIKGTTTGVTTNQDGEYSIEVGAGICTFVFQLTGYSAYSEQVNIQRDLILNVQLKEDAYQLKEIKVDAGKEDPAYPIIRAAQKKRSYYLHQVKSFSCDVYIKGLQRIKKYPRKILGREINLDNVVDTLSGIAYLSESFSKFYFRNPDKIKETLISSKVSGRNNAFTFNQATDVLFNFYENVIQTGFALRGLISPISSTCFLSYRYQFVGSFLENGVWVNKIKVIPKRSTDPCFSGHIYICDSTWRIYNIELIVTKQNQIKFVDTLQISQLFLPVNDSIWMPFTSKLGFTFSFFGFYGDGYFHGINSNYVVDPQVTRRFFDGEEWHVNADANKRNDQYWDSLRPIPLTILEERDYHRKDSLHKIWDSKPYKDSLDRRANRFKFVNLFQGYSYRNTWREYSISISPPIAGVLFSTVQGVNISSDISFLKRNKETRREAELSMSPEYGLSSKNFYLTGNFFYLYNPKKIASISLNVGRQLAQFNRDNAISPFVNTFYSLLDKRNYMKVYGRDFIELKWRNELINGLLVLLGGEFSERFPLLNHSAFTWVKKDYSYSSNDPLVFDNQSYSFQRNTKAELNLQFRIRFGQRYISYPNRKITMGSKFPEINVAYKKAIAGFFSSKIRYDFVAIAVSDRVNLKRLGKSQYLIRAGKFFNQKNLSFMDYKHFNGNQTIFSSFDLERFQLLDYYTFSTKDAFVEGWFEHNFSGLLISKIPLVKKIKMEEVLAVRYCNAPGLPHHFELSFGLKYFLIRSEFAYSPTNTKQPYGIRFGILF